MQNKKKRLVFRIIVLTILVVSLVVTLIVNAKKDNPILAVGDDAPDFMLDRLDSEGTIKLSDLKGKGVMINFWATYCEPCKEEMPYMDELYEKYKDQGFEIIAVSVDINEMVIRNFFERLQLSFPITHDKNRTIQELYNIIPLPTSFFINPDGTINEIIKGPLTLENLESYILNILPN